MEDYQANTNETDDDIIGEEVRPQPIDISLDGRSRALQALLLDHTYVQNTVSGQIIKEILVNLTSYLTILFVFF